MSEERKRVLEMVAAKMISVEEAERLLAALADGPEGEEAGGSPKFLRVHVDSGGEKVNVRVPLKLLRAGMKLGALIPGAAGEQVNAELRKHGIDLSNLKAEDFDDVIDSLAELEVDVQEGEEGATTVRVFSE
jgi:hypothetical protein